MQAVATPPRPEGRGMIWKGLRTPPKCSSELPGPKGPGFPFLDEWAKLTPVIREKLENVSIAKLENMRLSSSKHIFAEEAVLAYAKSFIQDFNFSHDTARLLIIIKDKKIFDYAKELLLEILDEVTSEWKKDISQ